MSRYGPYTKLAFATLFLLLPLNIIALDHHDDFPLATKNDSQRVAQKVDELRMIKRFGFGVGAAGGLSVVGGEIDFHLTSDLSMALGIGTGLDYTTWNVKGKYYLSGQWVSPYFAAGIARWYTHGTAEKTVGPAVLRNVFLSSDHDYSKGFSVFIFYPAIGVQLMHASGFAVSVEGQYLFRLVNFANGTYAGAGVHWYF